MKLMVMDSSGDSRVEFDQTDTPAREEARALFERLTATGGKAFQVNAAGEGDKPVTNFNDIQGDTLIVPRIVGG